VFAHFVVVVDSLRPCANRVTTDRTCSLRQVMFYSDAGSTNQVPVTQSTHEKRRAPVDENTTAATSKAVKTVRAPLDSF
jgi:hypothetical protein